MQDVEKPSFYLQGIEMTESFQGEENGIDALERLRFLEVMEEINQVIHRANDPEQMLWNVLAKAFSVLACDRIWLFHPCDPYAETYRIPVEITRDEYPGAGTQQIVPMKPRGDEYCAKALATDGPVLFGADTDPPIFRELAERFGVRSQISMAIYPKVGKPWMLGMHQCSHERLWTEAEQRLFEAIGRRIGEGLSTLLLLRDLRMSEERFDLAVKGTRDGLWDWPDVKQDLMWWSPRVYEIIGYSPDELPPSLTALKSLVHPEEIELAECQGSALLSTPGVTVIEQFDLR
ncbi:MAG: GAF domain-containing protein [Desulfuromonadales bacterium]|nr:GAF domain-containing protein [Desulfuromonadales bacterium]